MMMFALLLACPLLVCPPALALEAPPVSVVQLPQTPDHPTCKAAAALLTDVCAASESLSVRPPFGVQNRIGAWNLYTARCTDRATGKHRDLKFYAPAEVRDRTTDFIFENEGIRKGQVRRLLTAANGHARKVADVVIFAAPSLSGPINDGGGPVPADAPAVVDDVLTFALLSGPAVRIKLKGEGPIVVERGDK